MKPLLLFFLLSLPGICFAQNHLLLNGEVPPGAQRIVLPKTKYDNSFNSDRLRIHSDSAYKALFRDHDSLPAIDFMKYELFSSASCMWCARCERPQCHRNACDYTRSWYLLEKTALQRITPDTMMSGYCFFGEETLFRDDSVFAPLRTCEMFERSSPDFNKSVVITRQLHGDCHAQFRHELYVDTVNRYVVWRVYEMDGGCRSWRSYTVAAVVPVFPDDYRVVFEEYREK